MKTVIIDCGSGNLHSAHKAFERAATDSGIKGAIIVPNKAEDVETADRIVLPGVGAFKDCRDGLTAVPGMREVLQQQVIAAAAGSSASVSACSCWPARGLERRPPTARQTASAGWRATCSHRRPDPP